LYTINFFVYVHVNVNNITAFLNNCYRYLKVSFKHWNDMSPKGVKLFHNTKICLSHSSHSAYTNYISLCSSIFSSMHISFFFIRVHSSTFFWILLQLLVLFVKLQRMLTVSDWQFCSIMCEHFNHYVFILYRIWDIASFCTN